jgi:alkanesulfonate monooxygenase SsuD/methylene tetrahydromethanopterin reductase-like flavin-dependent oxidoreductase (luciferase family)
LNEDEHRGYGFDFPPIRERMDRLEEAVTIARLMFTEERPTLEGRYSRIERALSSPRPIHPGGPKILIGWGGEQRTLRIAARHADLTHWFAASLDQLRHKSEVLERYCADIGRDPSTIERAIGSPFLLVEHERDTEAALARLTPERRATDQVVTPGQAAEGFRPYVEAGFTGFTSATHRCPTRRRSNLQGRSSDLSTDPEWPLRRQLDR